MVGKYELVVQMWYMFQSYWYELLIKPLHKSYAISTRYEIQLAQIMISTYGNKRLCITMSPHIHTHIHTQNCLENSLNHSNSKCNSYQLFVQFSIDWNLNIDFILHFTFMSKIIFLNKSSMRSVFKCEQLNITCNNTFLCLGLCDRKGNVCLIFCI